MQLRSLIPLLKSAKSIAILPHVLVDGDGLGSSLALGLALTRVGKKALIYLEEDIPPVYDFLPGKQLTRNCRPECFHDVVVAIDAGDRERLGKRIGIFDKADITINIDHHDTNTRFACHNFINTGASAVGEIVYKIIKMMGITMDAALSTCLYVAIATDTGGFKYSNTTPVTHRIASRLISTGIDVADISRRIFDTVSIEKVRLMGMVINSLELFEDGKIAFITVTEDMMRDAGTGEEECNGLVNIGRNIKGVIVAALFKETTDEGIRVNLRTNTDVDVSAIAKSYSGGGHKKAAGCTVKGELTQVKQRLLEDIIRMIGL